LSTDKESACQYKGCGRKVARDGMCIFHLPDKNPSEAEEFDSLVLAEISRIHKDESLHFIDLGGFRFPRPIYKFPTGIIFEKPIDFTAALFEGQADFSGSEFMSGANFGYAIFSEKASFDRVIFHHAADFLGSQFLRDAVFTNSVFSRYPNFSHAKFSGDADFSNTRFLDLTFFINSEFLGSVSFVDVKFSGRVIFEKAKFSGWSTSFFGSEFLGDSDFFESKFSSHAVFNRSKVASLVTFRSTIFQTTDDQILSSPIDRYTHFEEIKVDAQGEVRFEGGICMSRVSLHNADVRRFNFLDVKWGRLGDRASIVEHAILEERKKLSADEKKGLPDITPEHIQQIYVRLRRNLERSAGRYPEAGDFFINEKEMRKLILQEKTGWPPARNLAEWIILKLYGWLALYGESIMRPIFWIVVTVFAFAALKIVFFRIQTTDAKPYLDFLMESVMAFFQMRSEPGLDILERLISVPILGSLFIALKRKFERR